MSSLSNENSSLPIEYQLQYGTAIRNADLSDFVNQANGFGVGSDHSGFTQKQVLSVVLSNSGPLFVNLSNS